MAGNENAERDTDLSDPASHLEQRSLGVENQIRTAMDRGDFDNLPGAGKPLPDLGNIHDHNWWVKRLVERERISGVLPPALALRKENAVFDEILDRENRADAVRELVTDFNRRIKYARLQLRGGPPVITPLRDVETEVERWQKRRDERSRVQAEASAPAGNAPPQRVWRRWGWLRRLGSLFRRH